MSSFSSILSSLGGGPQQAPQQAASTAPQAPPNGALPRQAGGQPNGTRPTPSNAAAGVKRKSEEPVSAPRPKIARTSTDDRHAPAAPPNRFQLPSKSAAPPLQRPAPAPTSNATPTPPSSSNGTNPAAKRGGFASILARASAAQAAAQAAGPSTIKHQPIAKHLSKKERQRMMEEAKATRKRSKGRNDAARSRSGTPTTGRSGAGQQREGKLGGAESLGYKGTMKPSAASTSAEPAYRGTMRTEGSAQTASRKKSARGRDRRDEYADTDDDDAESYGAEEEEDDEGGYGSDASSDMEGGLDDIEREEMASRRIAQKEDEKALAEEERLKREKEARRRRLAEMNKAAAAGKRKY